MMELKKLTNHLNVIKINIASPLLNLAVCNLVLVAIYLKFEYGMITHTLGRNYVALENKIGSRKIENQNTKSIIILIITVISILTQWWHM